MRTRAFGPSQIDLPVIGQGTWNMERDDRRSAIAAIRRGLDLGLTHVDTAELYGDGEVERLVADALEGRRDEVYLVSKVLPKNASPTGTIAACERSLKRLRTEVLDLYLLHWPGDHPLEDTIAAFERLVNAGKIRAWGVSNFDADEIDEVVALAGPSRVACNQVLYHLRERAIEHEVVPKCRDHGVAIVAYSPFGSGDFPGPKSAAGRELAAIASEVGVTPRRLALAFLTREPDVFAIPKASSVAHVDDNAGGDLELDPDVLQRIGAAFPLGRPRRGVPTI